MIQVIQDLARARDRSAIVDITRHHARALVGCDGATFVLRDGDRSYYVDEDAIGPLFKGLKFPLDACIGGWCMLNRTAVVVPDISADPRIPAEAYVKTFVKSLAMVPIRSEDPLGAIGVYWASWHVASPDEIGRLQALADSVSVAMQNVAVMDELEERVAERTAELELFAGAAAHDLANPLHVIIGNADALLADPGPYSPDPRRGCLEDIAAAANRMNGILRGLSRISRVGVAGLHPMDVDVSALATSILNRLRAAQPDRHVVAEVCPGLSVVADLELLRLALENLLENAWKYTGGREPARIEVGMADTDRGRAIVVRDNGVGFDPTATRQLFTPFRRLSPDFAGTGLGLVIVARVARKHRGEVWAEGTPGAGASFYLRIPPPASR